MYSINFLILNKKIMLKANKKKSILENLLSGTPPSTGPFSVPDVVPPSYDKG